MVAALYSGELRMAREELVSIWLELLGPIANQMSKTVFNNGCLDYLLVAGLRADPLLRT